ncbi:MAG: hypothetical protein R6V04_04775 [bacterium]
MLSKWKKNNGQWVLYLDCRGLDEEELLKILDEAAEALSPMITKVPVLANVEGAVLLPEFMEKMRQLGKEVFTKKVDYTAVVGVTGVKKVMLSSYNFLLGQNLKSFDTEESALEWLASAQEKSLLD